MASSTPRPPARRAGVLGLTALTLVGLTACGTPGGTAPAGGESPSGAISTELPTEDTTLTLLHTDTSGTIEALAEGFEKEHENITVDLQYTAGDSYNTSLDLTLGSDSAPDLAMLNMLGNTAKAGLLRPLDPYAEAYGWEDTVPTSQLDQWRAEDTGTLGSGTLWAAPAGFSLVGVYYNTELAASLGIEQPTTLDEFEAALQKAKDAGAVPLQQPNQGGQSSYVFQALTNNFQDPALSTEWAFGAPGSTIVSDAGTQAATTLAAWAAAGYIPESSNGTDGSGAVAEFVKGDSLFMLDGNWDATTVDEAMPGTAGFFTLPGTTPDAPSVGVGTSLALAIPAGAEHPDVAAAFLDYLTTPEAAAIEFANGYMPVAHADQVEAPEDSILADYLVAWDKVAQSNGLTPYFNNSTTTMNDTLTSQGQQLVVGRVTPQQYVEALQADWDKAHQ